MDRFAAMELFSQVAQDGSFSAVARQHDMTPSAVSKQIAKLEDRLGVRLIARTTRRLSLTEEGRAYLLRARRILAEVEEAEGLISERGQIPRGLLRLNLPVAFGRMYVTPLIPAFLDRYPEVNIDVTFNDRFVDLVDEGVDLVIRIGELTDSTMIARRLAHNRRLVCAAPAYFERHAVPQRPEDLLNHNCLIYTYRASRHDWRFLDRHEQETVVRVAGNFEANSAEALYDSVVAGLGVGLLPLWLVGRGLKTGELVEVLRDYHAPDSAIYAVYPPGRHLSPKVRSFIDHLVAGLKRQAFWSESSGFAAED